MNQRRERLSSRKFGMKYSNWTKDDGQKHSKTTANKKKRYCYKFGRIKNEIWMKHEL
jgi:hypothetical protein